MNKTEMYKELPFIAKSIVILDEGEAKVFGKFATVSKMSEDDYDIWVRHKNYEQGETLTNNKVTRILKEVPEEIQRTKLSGEAYFRCSKEQLKNLLKPLGIRRRRPPPKHGPEGK